VLGSKGVRIFVGALQRASETQGDGYFDSLWHADFQLQGWIPKGRCLVSREVTSRQSSSMLTSLQVQGKELIARSCDRPEITSCSIQETRR